MKEENYNSVIRDVNYINYEKYGTYILNYVIEIQTESEIKKKKRDEKLTAILKEI